MRTGGRNVDPLCTSCNAASGLHELPSTTLQVPPLHSVDGPRQRRDGVAETSGGQPTVTLRLTFLTTLLPEYQTSSSVCVPLLAGADPLTS